jgi:hypothetical protein
MHLRSLVTLTLLFGSLTHVACDDEEPPVKPLAEGIVEVGGGEARVRIALDPFRVEILDVAGSVVLESASPGAEDAYGAATGTLDEPIFAPQVLPGWDGYRPGEQPWRSARKARVVERAPSSVALLAEGNGVRIRYEVAVAGARVSLRLKTEEVAGAAPVNKTAMAFLSPQDEHLQRITLYEERSIAPLEPTPPPPEAPPTALQAAGDGRQRGPCARRRRGFGLPLW